MTTKFNNEKMNDIQSGLNSFESESKKLCQLQTQLERVLEEHNRRWKALGVIDRKTKLGKSTYAFAIAELVDCKRQLFKTALAWILQLHVVRKRMIELVEKFSIVVDRVRQSESMSLDRYRSTGYVPKERNIKWHDWTVPNRDDVDRLNRLKTQFEAIWVVIPFKAIEDSKYVLLGEILDCHNKEMTFSGYCDAGSFIVAALTNTDWDGTLPSEQVILELCKAIDSKQVKHLIQKIRISDKTTDKDVLKPAFSRNNRRGDREAILPSYWHKESIKQRCMAITRKLYPIGDSNQSARLNSESVTWHKLRWIHCQTDSVYQRWIKRHGMEDEGVPTIVTGESELQTIGEYEFRVFPATFWRLYHGKTKPINGFVFVHVESQTVLHSENRNLSEPETKAVSYRVEQEIANIRKKLERRLNERKFKAESLRKIRSIEVFQIDDSLKAGNCKSGTLNFINAIGLDGQESTSGRILAYRWRKAGFVQPERLLSVANYLTQQTSSN